MSSALLLVVLGAASGPLVESHLKRLMDGKIRGSFGFTEPDNVSPTSAQEDGYLLRINGQKSYVTGGEDADFINTLVQIEGKGPSTDALPDLANSSINLQSLLASSSKW